MTTDTSTTSFNPVPGATAPMANVAVKKRRSLSAKRAETKIRKESERGFPLPLVLTCTKTGKVVKYTSLSYIRKLVAKYGSVDELRKKYVSVTGRKV